MCCATEADECGRETQDVQRLAQDSGRERVALDDFLDVMLLYGRCQAGKDVFEWFGDDF
jgi:hypothetical protein